MSLHTFCWESDGISWLPEWLTNQSMADRLLGSLTHPCIHPCIHTESEPALRAAVSAPGGTTLIARFMGPTWGPLAAVRTQVGPMLVIWTLLSGYVVYITPAISHYLKHLASDGQLSNGSLIQRQISERIGETFCITWLQAKHWWCAVQLYLDSIFSSNLRDLLLK